MYPDFTLANQRNFHLSETLPLDYRSYILPGSDVLTATDPTLGSIVQQKLLHSNFSIRFNIFDFFKPVQLAGHQAGSSLVSFLALKNNLHFNFEGAGSLHLKQGQFALLHTADQPAAVQFTKPKPHECIEISWSDEWLKQMLTKFDFLQPLFKTNDQSASFFLKPGPRPAGVRALDLVKTMLTTPYDAETSRLLFESQAREYLILLLSEASRKVVPMVPLTDRERDFLVEIGNQINSTFDKKFNITELSRAAGMNTTKLRDGFREIHGSPISTLHMSARMHEARRLLKETDLSTKQISAKVGYKLTTSFIENFYKFFGYHSSQV